MSSPENMRTGFSIGTTPENYFQETFFIIYLILASILRRCGYKDAVLYAQHSKIGFSDEIFDSGVLFNLFSEYGVGKSLEPLIIELFSTTGLDPDANCDNVFFQEIARLSLEVSRIIRTHDPLVETAWMYNYVIRMENINDGISEERDERLSALLPPLFPIIMTSLPIISNISDSDDITVSDSDDDILSYDNSDCDMSYDNNNSNSMSECDCAFCTEFNEYHKPDPQRNVTEIINNTLSDVAKRLFK